MPQDKADIARYTPFMTDTTDDPSHAARVQILNAALSHVPFDGWSDKSLRAAVADCELPDGSEGLFFPGGAVELISFWSQQCDAQAASIITAMDLPAMKIRARVTAGVIARFEAIGAHEDAAQRAMAKLSLPSSGTAGPKAVWASADMIWRAIGDTSTDGNFYSKRAVLSAVISTSLVSWLSDENADKTRARAFLDRRIENVMQFEKFKAKAKGAQSGLPNPVRFFSDLRYGRASRRRYQSRY